LISGASSGRSSTCRKRPRPSASPFNPPRHDRGRVSQQADARPFSANSDQLN
jgi:hypothetical protein